MLANYNGLLKGVDGSIIGKFLHGIGECWLYRMSYRLRVFILHKCSLYSSLEAYITSGAAPLARRN